MLDAVQLYAHVLSASGICLNNAASKALKLSARYRVTLELHAGYGAPGWFPPHGMPPPGMPYPFPGAPGYPPGYPIDPSMYPPGHPMHPYMMGQPAPPPERQPASSMSFPPGLIPQLVKEKNRCAGGGGGAT